MHLCCELLVLALLLCCALAEGRKDGYGEQRVMQTMHTGRALLLNFYVLPWVLSTQRGRTLYRHRACFRQKYPYPRVKVRLSTQRGRTPLWRHIMLLL